MKLISPGVIDGVIDDSKKHLHLSPEYQQVTSKRVIDNSVKYPDLSPLKPPIHSAFGKY